MSPTPSPGPPSGKTGQAADPRRLIGQVISGRYRIDELIGEGGMGAVYRAEHTHMRKRLAVKVLHAEMLHVVEAVERFEREAIAGAHIEHPNVAAAMDFGKLDDGAHFLVLEFLVGEDLRSVIGRGPIAPERAIKIARQITMALRAAHQIGIVHRDLKPENVMLVRRENEPDFVKVLDFGIAKVPVNDLTTRGSPQTAALTKLGMVYGTPEYMAPEQALGEEVDGRADLYALGVIFYEMLCGLRPFVADSRVVLLGMVATKKPPRLVERVPATLVPPQIEDIVMRLLEKNSADRFATAEDALEAIDIAILELDISLVGPRSLDRALRGSIADRVVVSRASSVARSEAPNVLRAGLLATQLEQRQPSVVDLRAARDAAAPDASRFRLRRLLPHAVREVPGAALLVAAGMAATVLAVFAGVLLRSSATVAGLEASATAAPERASQTAAPPAAGVLDRLFGGTASENDLAAAKAKGVTALAPLAERYPTDKAVLEALMVAHAAAPGGLAAAVGVAKQLLERSADAAADEDVQRVVTAAAAGSSEAQERALELMGNDMGSRGPELLYNLALSSPSLKSRVYKVLGDPIVLDRATPALRIAYELRVADSCKEKKPLLERAGEVGDARAFAILQPLVVSKGRGCGFFGLGNCGAPCQAISKEIKRAISEIEAREGKLEIKDRDKEKGRGDKGREGRRDD